ncbi:MAG TPA: amino acid adenylation domain-containing protein, partial [Kofleriaceae bacterium]
MPLPVAWTTLAAAFADRVATSPGALAVYDRNERLSYAALAARARQIEMRLVEHGVRRGARVGIMLDRSIAAIATMLAIWELGAVLVPIDPRWPTERRDRIAVDLELAAVVSEDAIVSHPKIATNHERPAPGCLALYTSGSTGDPQAVVISDHALLWRFHALALAMPFASGEVACHRTPPTFIDAYAEVFGPLLHGVPVFVLPHPFEVRDLVAAIEREHVTRLLLVPSILALLLDARPDLSSVRLVATSGEALPSTLARRFHAAAPGVRLVNIYGSTEVAGDATVGDVTWPVSDRVTIGKPLAGVTATIVDERGEQVENGEVGELVVAGPICANGYWNRSVTTSARFVHDASGAVMVRTGDLAHRDRVGELVLVGRVDDQVKIGGCRIELGEIDRALASHPQVNAAAAAVTYDGSGRARLVAGIVGSADLDGLRGHLAARLPAAAVPSVLSQLDALPVTSHGKLDRRELAALVVRRSS